jgi:hypothetical protein
MHGFASATAVQEIVRASLVSGQPLVALYVGDHDPSGLHMSEGDLPGRLWAYRLSAQIADDASRESPAPRIVRLSLTAEDVEDPELPSFDADTKREDPRWRWYVERYGTPCWELDALSPVVVLRERAEAAIAACLDLTAWTRYVVAVRAELASITESARAWKALAAVGAR